MSLCMQMVMEQKFLGPGVDEDEDEAENNFNNRKQGQLQFINQCVHTMSFPPFSPRQQQMYSMGYVMSCIRFMLYHLFSFYHLVYFNCSLKL